MWNHIKQKLILIYKDINYNTIQYQLLYNIHNRLGECVIYIIFVVALETKAEGPKAYCNPINLSSNSTQLYIDQYQPGNDE